MLFCIASDFHHISMELLKYLLCLSFFIIHISNSLSLVVWCTERERERDRVIGVSNLNIYRYGGQKLSGAVEIYLTMIWPKTRNM